MSKRTVEWIALVVLVIVSVGMIGWHLIMPGSITGGTTGDNAAARWEELVAELKATNETLDKERAKKEESKKEQASLAAKLKAATEALDVERAKKEESTKEQAALAQALRKYRRANGEAAQDIKGDDGGATPADVSFLK